MDIIEIGRKVLMSEAQMLQQLAEELDGSLEQAVHLLAEL